jgi:NADH dehydrogenase FAD-containing subunit
MKKPRVLIVGGGFGGLYAALEFERRRDPDVEVTLINQENFFLRASGASGHYEVARWTPSSCVTA